MRGQMTDMVLCYCGKVLIFSFVLIMTGAAVWAGPSVAKELALVEEGKSAYTIAISSVPDPAEEYAAEELQALLKRISGAELPISTEPVAGPKILVRISQGEGDVLEGVPARKLGEEELLMQTVGEDLVLAGGGPRGVLYAVYRFLDEKLGCRWYAPANGPSPACERIPQMSTIKVPSLEETQKPAFDFRYPYLLGHEAGPQWDVRNGINGTVDRPRIPPHLGGDYMIRGIHNSLDVLRQPGEDTPQKLFSEHPEYFSLIDGKRTCRQLCVTNPELVDVMAEAIQADYDRYKPDLIGISQMDGGGQCECEKCKALEEQEGGTAAGPWLHFVNAVAEKLPHLKLWTFAYSWTNKPPEHVKPRENVWIWFCGSPGAQSGVEIADLSRLEKWCELAPKRVIIWTYDFINNQVEFSTKPALFVAARQLRNFHRIGGRGVFLQCGETSNTASPFSELHNYVLARLLWDPYVNTEPIVQEFLEAYYGQAAPYVAAYRELNHAMYLTHLASALASGDEEKRYNIVAGQSGLYVAIGEENIATLEAYLDQAEEAAENDVVRNRVRVLRLPIWHYRLMMAGRPDWMANSVAYRNSTRGWYWDNDEVEKTVAKLTETMEYKDLIDSYLATMRWRQVGSFREYPVHKWLDALEMAQKEWQTE